VIDQHGLGLAQTVGHIPTTRQDYLVRTVQEKELMLGLTHSASCSAAISHRGLLEVSILQIVSPINRAGDKRLPTILRHGWRRSR
jgi:hypothetical protein